MMHTRARALASNFMIHMMQLHLLAHCRLHARQRGAMIAALPGYIFSVSISDLLAAHTFTSLFSRALMAYFTDDCAARYRQYSPGRGESI